MKRKRFDLRVGDPFVLDVDGHPVEYGQCREIATFRNFDANIVDALLKTMGGRYIRTTVVGADETLDDYGGISKGWYVASWVDEAAALQLGEMWGADQDDVLWSPPASSS